MSDWGQGVINNTIGWGRGAINNLIGWGASYIESWAGDTEIYGYDADANSYFTDNENAGGVLSNQQKIAWSNFIVGLKNNGLYSRAKFLLPKMGATALSAAIDATGNLSPTISGFIDTDADSVYGLQGQSATAKRINFGVNASTLFEGQFNWTLGVHILTPPTTSNCYIIGSAAGTFFQVIRCLSAGGRIIGYGNTSTINVDSNPSPTFGNITLVKRANNSLELYNDGVSLGTNTTVDSGALTSLINLFEFSENAVSSTDDSKHGLSYCFDALSDSEVVTLNGLIAQFKTDLGL